MEIIFRKRETLLCRVVQNKNNLKWPQVILPNMEYDHKFKNMAAFETKARIVVHGVCINSHVFSVLLPWFLKHIPYKIFYPFDSSK